MNDPDTLVLKEMARETRGAGEPHLRAVGSPLPVGGGGRAAFPADGDEGQRLRTVPPPGRALSAPSEATQAGNGFQWAAGAIRQAIPFLQRILPLLDGHVATTISNLLAPHPPQPAPQVDLAPLEDGLAELKIEHSELRGQIVEQNSSLKRVEDQLEMVREATDRNTLEQQELMEDLKSVGSKMNFFALVMLGLLVISILLNVMLFLHISRVLP